MDYSAAARAVGAVVTPENPMSGFSSVVIDSRQARPGSLFAAIPGTQTDGHRFVQNALKAGAAAVLVTRVGLKEAGIEKEELAKQGAVILETGDTLLGLQKLAAAYLDQFPRLLRVGITGSSGKTTTKEIAAAMIGAEKSVVVNPGNLNSETGLPLAVFEVRSHHEVGIFEVGMNRKGEIAELAAVLKPSVALITNIGPAHIGILGSLEAIAEEKKKIFSLFHGTTETANSGYTALVPEDDPFKEYLAMAVAGKVIFYGSKNLEAEGVLGTVTGRGLAGTEIVWEGVPAVFGLPGNHNLKNALAAAALARTVGTGGEAIRRGFAQAKPLFGRGEILWGKTTVIRDCYNANPDSAARALEFCDSLSWPGRRVYIMGAMLELGNYSGAAHEELGKQLAASRGDMVFLYGEETLPAAEVLAKAGKSFFHTNAMEELSRAAAEYIRPGDMVLLKGSRGCALESLSSVVSLETTEGAHAKGVQHVS